MGLTGSLIILIIALMAASGNAFISDKTPDANWQCLPICKLRPFSKVTFFEIPNNEQLSLWEVWLHGAKDPVLKTPVRSFKISGDTAYLKLYSSDPTDNQTESIPLNQYAQKYRIIETTYYLGTDVYGRDVLSRVVLGAGVSLSVGMVTVIIALFTGTLLGMLAGYFRGLTDHTITWFINVIWSLPTILLVVAVSFAIGHGFWQVFVAIGLSSWVEIARVVRGQVFSIREKEYIQSARVLGFGPLRIMFRHILPNLRSTLIVLSVSVFGTAILVESGLSFVGLGLAPPASSWGMMIRENYREITLDHPYLAIIPGICIMALVMAFNFVGIALRDALDINLE